MDIKRAKRDRWLLGVCGGIAHHYGWNSNLVRLVTAVIAVGIPGPSTVLAGVIYVLLGLYLPETEEY